MIAANLEREIDEDITKLEQLWYPIIASAAENDYRLEATTRTLIELGVRTRQFATYVKDQQGYCKSYVSHWVPMLFRVMLYPRAFRPLKILLTACRWREQHAESEISDSGGG